MIMMINKNCVDALYILHLMQASATPITYEYYSTILTICYNCCRASMSGPGMEKYSMVDKQNINIRVAIEVRELVLQMLSEVSRVTCHFLTIVTIFMRQFEDRCHIGMHQYVKLCLSFHGVLSNHVVTGHYPVPGRLVSCVVMLRELAPTLRYA